MPADAASPFQALADPTRRAILKLLRGGSRTAGEIAEAIPDLSKPTLSHHFRVLAAAGLVRAERRGTFVVYTLQSNVLEDLAAELIELSSGLGAARRPNRERQRPDAPEGHRRPGPAPALPKGSPS